ncbi:hypothetical protein CEXT_482201 [Caerostris extrusa]|uniref:RNase H type-1 domain-containing protein n=1 Tax=Caerostris extrusa TaxID=172846 RepID=A0AAV4W560_CAEEX|nr:hypothetical protein CEXT_482201 [Caerostris extrusa]
MDLSCSDSLNGGARVFSIFFFYDPVGRGAMFDGKIAAFRTALSQLHCHLDKFTSDAILCNSMATLLAIVSDNNPLKHGILDCRLHLQNLTFLEKNITLQWVLTHCIVPGNEKVDYLAKKDALIMQSTSRSLPFYAIKHLVKKSIKSPCLEGPY